MPRIRVRYSHYWPPLGPPNCARFDWRARKCLSRLSNGDPWEAWAEKGAACPRAWPLGTRFRAFGQEWTCVDRYHQRFEGADPPWVDFMTARPHAAYGEIVEIEILTQ